MHHQSMYECGFFKTGVVRTPLDEREVIHILSQWSLGIDKLQNETKLARAGWFQAMPHDLFRIKDIGVRISKILLPIGEIHK